MTDENSCLTLFRFFTRLCHVLRNNVKVVIFVLVLIALSRFQNSTYQSQISVIVGYLRVYNYIVIYVERGSNIGKLGQLASLNSLRLIEKQLWFLLRSLYALKTLEFNIHIVTVSTHQAFLREVFLEMCIRDRCLLQSHF